SGPSSRSFRGRRNGPKRSGTGENRRGKAPRPDSPAGPSPATAFSAPFRVSSRQKKRLRPRVRTARGHFFFSRATPAFPPLGTRTPAGRTLPGTGDGSSPFSRAPRVNSFKNVTEGK